jgi:hypothetical protein
MRKTQNHDDSLRQSQYNAPDAKSEKKPRRAKEVEVPALLRKELDRRLQYYENHRHE